ncbi:MAG: cystathionine beta-synthase [Gaiellales bacterium]|nr:cystathionine beta-synthase [Gaiellales bacterium]
MREFPTLLELVGNTPIIRLPQIQPVGGARLLAKLEYLNPGGSIKDRIGLPMIEAAEREGLLRPGGTIVEPTSGNTGVGLAMVAAARGYRCIFVLADKQSPEKIQLLRALGAEVVVCPTDVEPSDPRSYYSVSRRLAEETPNAFNPNQYANAANPATHYATTGPEIWEQLGDELDCLVVGVGTGGTVTGVGRYLKEQNPAIEIVGADPEGSIYTGAVHSYLIEGVGEDFWPETFDRTIVDRWVQVSDRDAFLCARRVAAVEGMLIGGSGGMAVQAALTVASELPPDKTVLVILPDGGRPYLSKVFDDDWMRSHGLLDRPGLPPTVADLMRAKSTDSPDVPSIVTIATDAPGSEAIDLLQRYGISQLPVRGAGVAEAEASVSGLVGSIEERTLLDRVFREGGEVLARPVQELMSPPLEVVDVLVLLDDVYGALQSNPALVIADEHHQAVGVLTRTDLLEFLAHRRT